MWLDMGVSNATFYYSLFIVLVKEYMIQGPTPFQKPDKGILG